ncbi:MAG: aminodeoxychorismate synthase component I [Cycloclasticus sp.]|nr:aminodeoxychorismate synthase component I [Cycloclasticus sp. 44_32_T64]
MTLVIEDCGHFAKAKVPFGIDLLDCHAVDSKRYPFLLESHGVSRSNDSFDILFAFPGETIELSNPKDVSFFSRFDQAFNQDKQQNKTNVLPFTGGWFVFLSYELVGLIEQKLSGIRKDGSLPLASAVRIPAAIIKSHKDQTCWIVCESGQEALIEQTWADIQRLIKHEISLPLVTLEEDNPKLFLDGVKKIKSYLLEGDTLQVNLSRQWKGSITDDSRYLDVYRSLRMHNPSPFAGLACYGDSVICSSSPERLVKCTEDTVEMRPIAGTRPRDDDAAVDKSSAEELLLNSKENAEHIMLIDLIRNDLGRICKTGTVTVDEKMAIESYAAVHHLVSNVSGKLIDNTTPSDVIKAVFPGGTITGCPKVRCMEIIHELEDSPRGAYTGSMGYINRNGDLDLNILIRTFTVKGQELSLRTGAGIVADSIAERELEETRHKAKALLAALNIYEA